MENIEIYKNRSLLDLEGEVWMPVVGYDSYLVSNMGRVKSFSPTKSVNRKDKILAQNVGKIGYSNVVLSKNNIPKTLKVHRIVATAFIHNPLNKKEVNHKNLIKYDNTLSNLEWVTKEENFLHALENNVILKKKDRLKKLPPIHSLKYLGAKEVYLYNNKGDLVAWYGSIAIFCSRLNIDKRKLNNSIRRGHNIIALNGLRVSMDKAIRINPS